MIRLDARELRIRSALRALKSESGAHSPSLAMISGRIPEVRAVVDACFLSNPYAARLFVRHFRQDIVDQGRLQSVFENYPSQNRALSRPLPERLRVAADRVLVGNGATELIQAVLQRFCERKLLLNVPTFSPYYEFVPAHVKVVMNPLSKENGLKSDPAGLLEAVRRERPDAVVLINPSNPDGGFLSHATIRDLLRELRAVSLVILDESFLHFATDEDPIASSTAAELTQAYENLVIVKSLSKDFGIAGLRVGYAVMSPRRVAALLAGGLLWNSNGVAQYFLEKLADDRFVEEYEAERLRYVKETRGLFRQLSAIPEFRTYESHANFALIEFQDGTTAEDAVTRMLARHGVYVRNCQDKIGLEGELIRVSARTREENQLILRSLKELSDEKETARDLRFL